MAASGRSHEDDIAHKGLGEEIESNLTKFKGLIQAMMGPVHAKYPYLPTNNPPAANGSILKDLPHLGLSEIKTLGELFLDKAKGSQNDNTLILEHLVQALQSLPSDSKFANDMTNGFINDLWDALPHPPATSLGEKYKYRQADGGNNNIDNPDLGRAHTAYARSARPSALQNIGLPDPADIFDSVMARPKDHFVPHPNSISSMLFYLASIIIHDCFRTDHHDFNNSMTSSYLDLAPLYGSTWEEQKLMRTGYDGKIKPDAFSEKRLLGFPPGTCAILVMFNRYHNYIVDRLAVINENGRFTRPDRVPDDPPWSECFPKRPEGELWDAYDKEGLLPKLEYDAAHDQKAKAAWAKYDNDLFQTARLVNCGLYCNIILKDYVRTILNLNSSGSTWDLDPRTTEVKTLFNVPAPEGVGNQVSAEFNLIYRWHSAISKRDEKWTEDAYEKMMGGKYDPDKIDLKDMVKKLSAWEKGIEKDPAERTFGGMKRDPRTGKFNDDELVEILTSSVEDVAGSFGANKVPHIMKGVEILGIMQARKWNLASLNEFRKFFGLTPHETFEDITGDPVTAKKLQNLYDHPDFVELYPGLVAEKAKPPMIGSGLCVNYTISRAILSDAVGLVRGDRFYTVDYTPKNLTNFGYKEVAFDLTVNQGCVAYKLFYNAFPNHFSGRGNSIYAHFPFTTPKKNEEILTKLGRAHLFDFSRPKRIPDLVVIDTYKAAVQILEDKETYRVTWGDAIAYMVKHPGASYGANYCLAGDGAANKKSRDLVMHGLYPSKWKSEVKKFYEDITTQLLRRNAYRIGNKYQVDIIRDVAALANTHFSASLFNLPLKTDLNPHGIYTEQQLYQVLSILFMAIFYDVDPSKSFLLRGAAQELTAQLGSLIMMNVQFVAKGGLLAEIVQKLHAPTGQLSEYGVHMIQRLLDGGMSIEEVVWTNLVPTAASMVANQAQLFAQVLDFYLEKENEEHFKAIQELACREGPEVDEKILRYFLEASRLRSTAGLFRSVHCPPTASPSPSSPSSVTIQDGPSQKTVPHGHRLLVNIVAASRDPDVFPDPLSIKLDRPMDKYIHYGHGPHQCAGLEASQVALGTLFKKVMALKGLRRVKGEGGRLKKVPAPHGYTVYMQSDWSGFFGVPVTMRVEWDGDGKF